MEISVSDATLVEEVRRGDVSAFGTLVERYQEVAFRAGFLILRDRSAAEDTAQEAFIRAYRHLGSFREGLSFKPWLLRIVTNLALNEVRARGRRGGLLARFASSNHGQAPAADAALLPEEQRDALQSAMNELPLDDRVVLYLRFFLEMPEKEMADALNVRPGTVKSRLHRACGRLRSLIETRYPQLLEEPL